MNSDHRRPMPIKLLSELKPLINTKIKATVGFINCFFFASREFSSKWNELYESRKSAKKMAHENTMSKNFGLLLREGHIN